MKQKQSKKDDVSKTKNDIIVQEDQQQCIELTDSFLNNIFNNDNITDISYNGKNFYYVDNEKGRNKLNLDKTAKEVYDYVKKIANYMLKPFSGISPTLDVSFGDYRLSAIHPTLARDDNQRVITFSIRKITKVLKIKENDILLCPLDVHVLLKALVCSYQSILISGQTGSGKTEFQKYLISLMNPKDRLIVIEESYETHVKEIFKDRDINSWLYSNKIDSLGELIKAALRNNPDWIIVAEVRGIESYDMVNAIMTGHSAITTLHSESAKYSLDRISNMCKKSIDVDEKMFLSNMAKHIKIGIHLEKIYNPTLDKYIRRISEIVEYISTENGYMANTIFEIVKNDDLNEYYIFNKISEGLKKDLIKNNININLINKFIKESK